MRNRRSLSSPTDRVKAMVVPSGDHTGAPACSVPSVSCVHSPEATSTTCTWLRTAPNIPEPSAW